MYRRKYISGNDKKLMLMILSSSAASDFEGKKKSVGPKDIQWKGYPLSGVEWDKKRFK